MRDKFDEALENFSAGKYYNTLAYCRSALNQKQRDAKEIYFLMGLAHAELGTWVTEWDLNDKLAANQCFEAVIRLEPDCVAAYFQHGLAILRWGNNYRMALADFEKVLALEPDNVEARRYCEICRQEICNQDSTDGSENFF